MDRRRFLWSVDATAGLFIPKWADSFRYPKRMGAKPRRIVMRGRCQADRGDGVFKDFQVHEFTEYLTGPLPRFTVPADARYVRVITSYETDEVWLARGIDAQRLTAPGAAIVPRNLVGG